MTGRGRAASAYGLLCLLKISSACENQVIPGAFGSETTKISAADEVLRTHSPNFPGTFLAPRLHLCMVPDKGGRGTRVSVMTPMNPPEEFLKHAAECELMAKFTRDPKNKAAWSRMAERWLRCAELFTSQSLAAHSRTPAKPHRKPTPGWAYPLRVL